MIGILFALITFGERVVDSAYKAVQNYQGHQRGLDRKANGTDNTNTYFDWRGTRRDLDTHDYRFVDPLLKEHYGEDQCIKDIRGNVVRNLSEERRQAAFEQAKQNPFNTVALHRKTGNGLYAGGYRREFGGDGYCEGTQYKDLKTGEIYVARYFEGTIVYMDLSGKLIRESDQSKQERRNGESFLYSESEIEKYIEEYNSNRIRKIDLGTPNYNSCLYLHRLNELYMNKNKVW